TTPTLDESLLATGFPYNIREGGDNNLKEYAAFSVRARAVRRLGSAVLYPAGLAGGGAGGSWGLRLGPGAGARRRPTRAEARGRVDMDSPSLVASNGGIHAAILDVLREVRGGPR